MTSKLLAILLVAVLWAGTALALPTVNSLVTAQAPSTSFVQFGSASVAATYAVLFTAGANGSRCNGVWTANNDTITHLVTLAIQSTTALTTSGVSVPTGGAATVNFASMAITTVAGAGTTTGTPPQNILSTTNWPGLPTDLAGNPYLQIPANMTLVVQYATAITATDVLNVFASCVNF